MERNLSILRTKYPIYEAKVEEFVMMDSLKVLRELLVMLISSTEVGASLIIDNDLGGGAHQFRRDKIDEIVGAGRGVFLKVTRIIRKRLRSWNLLSSLSFSFSIRDPYDLLELFLSLKIKEIVVNSFVSFPNVGTWIALITEIRSVAGCRLVFLVHDYFSACPSYTLINDLKMYCGIPSDLKICRDCLNRNTGDFKRFETERDIVTWRTQWGNFLRSCDEMYVLVGRQLTSCDEHTPLFRRKRLSFDRTILRGGSGRFILKEERVP